MAKQAIYIYLKEAIESGFPFVKRRFENLTELNRNFHEQRTWIFERLERKVDYKRRLVRVLEVIKMHSVKHLGISYLTENSLSAAYAEQFKESISKRTVGTCIKHLREIGFLHVIPTKRADGKQSANILVLERFRGAAETSSETTAASASSTAAATTASSPSTLSFSPLKVAHKNEKNLRTQKTLSLSRPSILRIKERQANKRQLLNFVPKWFQEQVGCLAREARDVFEYWKVTKQVIRRTFSECIEQPEREQVVRAAIRSFYQAAKAATKGKFQMQNPFGFFHEVLRVESSAHVRRKAQEVHPILFDWLRE